MWCAFGAASSSWPALMRSSGTSIATMFDYEFMVNGFEAATIVAIAASLVGYFLVLRGQTFAGHALSHVGFAGATGAALVGLSPLAGMIVLTGAAGTAMGA